MKIDARDCTGCTGLHGNVLCNPCNYENIEVFAERAGGCTGCTEGSLCNPSKTLLETRLHGLHGLHPLKGAPPGRATPAPMPLGVPRFPNTPTRALDAIRELVFNFDRHAKAQTEADTPAHGLLTEEPEMNSTNPRARFWTEAELNLLRTSWAAGLSCSEIAAKLHHRSSNAVGGMAHRLGLPVRGPGVVSRSKPRTQTPRRPTATSRGTIIRDYVAARITLAGPSWSHGGGV
jgi:hypothetical protein